jgi:hypothetical protein
MTRITAGSRWDLCGKVRKKNRLLVIRNLLKIFLSAFLTILLYYLQLSMARLLIKHNFKKGTFLRYRKQKQKKCFTQGKLCLMQCNGARLCG